MLKIGEFSKLSRVSVRMLRHYDEIGLLKPAEVDPFTDYRYYREEQFFAAWQEELMALSWDTARKLTLLDAARKRLRKLGWHSVYG